MKMHFSRYTALLLVLVIAGCQPPVVDQKEKTVPAAVGTGGVELEKLDGSGSVSMNTFLGRPLLVHFFAPWTEGGRNSASWLNQLHLENLEVIVVAVDQRTNKTQELSSLELFQNRLVFRSNEQLVGLVGGVRALPTSVLLDHHGKILKKWQGYLSPEEWVSWVAGKPQDAL